MPNCKTSNIVHSFTKTHKDLMGCRYTKALWGCDFAPLCNKMLHKDRGKLGAKLIWA